MAQEQLAESPFRNELDSLKEAISVFKKGINNLNTLESEIKILLKDINFTGKPETTTDTRRQFNWKKKKDEYCELKNELEKLAVAIQTSAEQLETEMQKYLESINLGNYDLDGTLKEAGQVVGIEFPEIDDQD